MARYVLSPLPLLPSLSRGSRHYSASVFSCRSSPISTLLKRIMSYSISESGAPNSLDYRVYFRNPKGQAISPFHDIPLFANDEKTVFNMVVEIPRWTNAKMEICTKEALNPIKQDCKKGKLRYVHNCFPYHGYIWNYGALPQTWEDPNHKDADTGCMGDNDPIDVCEIGTLVAKQGEVKQIKVLATLALIDEGETDWKILGIDVNDPVAKDMNDVEDIEQIMPGLLQATVDWFKIYKIPAGSKENEFAFDGETRNKEFALKIIDETHQSWKKLVMKEVENNKGLACKNVTVQDSPYNIAPEEAEGILKHAAKFDEALDVDAEVGRWDFVKRTKL